MTNYYSYVISNMIIPVENLVQGSGGVSGGQGEAGQTEASLRRAMNRRSY